MNTHPKWEEARLALAVKLTHTHTHTYLEQILFAPIPAPAELGGSTWLRGPPTQNKTLILSKRGGDMTSCCMMLYDMYVCMINILYIIIST
jgi:hypothetical protein